MGRRKSDGPTLDESVLLRLLPEDYRTLAQAAGGERKIPAYLRGLIRGTHGSIVTTEKTAPQREFA
jgi:hypothetical protein